MNLGSNVGQWTSVLTIIKGCAQQTRIIIIISSVANLGLDICILLYGRHQDHLLGLGRH